MSAYPRRVLTSLWVPNGAPNHPGAAPNTVYVRAGTLVDVQPGSALEQLYGGSSNLTPVIPVSQRGDEACLDKSALSN